ncbi:bifunctional phosphoserine phosphatase/homoserine phosphotransferase ThrH [Hydrogenophilus thiooxidans]|uniref:bifunctional phosphoserine phosphatase/homoserine phosphotransferase ThrH n=1 Tax=Hydrogenophilus thiooxidans TaxID=2820326 RepID=UPI001C213762|nr:bifunctional phosphoserine phosphatase/homoserine phosphotransferase ThrH [Hydrogenophilus thiooxidans]
MELVCLDLEGVLIPEMWVAFAEAVGIPELKRTTRQEPDYDRLMRFRLKILEEHGLGIREIERVIATLEPLPGAKAFLDGLRERYQVIILSDTFQEFARPLMRQLGWPTLFCHNLVVAPNGTIAGYRLRMKDQKREAVKRFKELNFRVVAAGDSYNDTTMLAEADAGILFRAPQAVVEAFPQFSLVPESYRELRAAIDDAFTRIAQERHEAAAR